MAHSEHSQMASERHEKDVQSTRALDAASHESQAIPHLCQGIRGWRDTSSHEAQGCANIDERT
jgi:hypothetical protein